MADVPVLMCTRGALEGERISVPDGGLEIGRSDENDVVITDEGVSRFHARLLYDNGQLWLQDAGSRNGVFVNAVRVTGHRALSVGDEITVAQHTFVVRWDEPDDEADPVGSTRRASQEAMRRAAELPPPGAEDDPSRRRWWWPFS